MALHARRPNIFDEKAIREAFKNQGMAPSIAEVFTGDMKLIVPLIIRELGVDKINQLLERARPELGLNHNAFWPHLTPHLMEWAEDELEAYKARKGARR